MQWFSPLLKFFLHVTIGTAIFGVVSAPAVALSCYMERLAALCSRPTIMLLTVGEYALLVVDVALLLVFLTKTGLTAARELWSEPTKEPTKQQVT